jgi:hypothetical protein
LFGEPGGEPLVRTTGGSNAGPFSRHGAVRRRARVFPWDSLTLVTTIEILGPDNKTRGEEGRDPYLKNLKILRDKGVLPATG